MADFKPLKIPIKANFIDSQQSQPWAILCVLPFAYPDTYKLSKKDKTTDNALAVKKYVIVSDLLSVSVNSTKGDSSNVAEMLLASGDIDYTSVFNPGDHCFIWMGNDKDTYQRIAQSLTGPTNALPALNDADSGLKFVGRINSVRETLINSGGIKMLRYQLTAQAFTEFATMIYYNPYMKSQSDLSENPTSFYQRISQSFDNYFKSFAGGGFSIETLIDFYIDVFIGSGPSSSFRQSGIKNNVSSSNNSLLLPKAVSALLGVAQKKKKQLNSYADVLHYIMGIQKYKDSQYLPVVKEKSKTNNQKVTSLGLPGAVVGLPDLNSNTTLLNLIRSFMNPPLNELYFTLRLNENNQIFPTMILRQKPFGSISRGNRPRETSFFELPRWQIDQSRQIHSYNLGNTNVVRSNFLVLFGSLNGLNAGNEEKQSYQILDGNYAIDTLDVIRSGSKNLFYDTNVDVSISAKNTFTAVKYWKDLIADWDINLHLKFNGSMTLTGVQECIAPGDNLEYDNKLFHIEGIQHQYQVEETGTKHFMTSLALSHGVLLDGKYVYTSGDKRSDKSGVYPGYSDEQFNAGNKRVSS